MSAPARVEYEQRMRPRYAALSLAAGILIVVAAVVQLAGPHTKVDELTLDLITAHKRYPLDVIGAVINAFGLVAFALTVSFLFTCTQARRPATHVAARIATLVGGVVAALAGIAYAVVIAATAKEFVTHGQQTYEQAHHLTNTPGLVLLPFLGQASALLLAIGIFFIAMNAMRTGLLTRFMGYLGIFVGVLEIFPIGSPVPVVQGFWLVALAVLFAGRWPAGTPLAWKTGRAEAWPSTAELREQREQRVRGGRGAAGGRAGVGARGATADGGRGGRAALPEPAAAPAATATPRSTRAETPKRKRKKRK
jgi:hypothetical protein